LLLTSLPFYSISARQATPQIMIFLPLILMYVFHVFTKSERKSPAWLTLVFLAGISFYTPGLLWWLVVSTAVTYKKLAASASKLPKAVVIAGLGLLCAFITPLIIIMSLHASYLKQLLLIPPV